MRVALPEFWKNVAYPRVGVTVSGAAKRKGGRKGIVQ